jgi:hypothetical protein
MLVQTGCTDRWEKPVPASEWPTPADGRGSKHNGHSPVHRHLGSSSLPKMELTCFSTVDEDRCNACSIPAFVLPLPQPDQRRVRRIHFLPRRANAVRQHPGVQRHDIRDLGAMGAGSFARGPVQDHPDSSGGERSELAEGRQGPHRKNHGLAPRALLHRRHSTRNGPPSTPPAATGTTWSAVRSVLGCGSRCQPGHQSPYVRRHWSTAAARRRLWAAVYGRTARLRCCACRARGRSHRGQREPDGTNRPHVRQGRGVTASASALSAAPQLGQRLTTTGKPVVLSSR